MTTSKSLLGMLCLSVFAICAFAASSAQATTMHECIKVSEGETAQAYSDPNCSVKSAEGKFRTVPLPANTPIKVEATLTPTTFVEGKEELHTNLTTTVGGVPFEITCTELSSPGATAENKEAGEVMEVVGKGTATYSHCTIPKPAGQGCMAHSAGQEAGMITTNSLTSKTKDTAEERMDVEYVPTAGAEEPFVTLIVEKCKTAALNGNKPIYGSALASQTTPTSQTVNVATLHFGSPTGPAATYKATVHFNTGGIPEAVALETPSSVSTMHECVKEAGTGTKYSDAKCSTQSAEGEYQTKTLPANTPIGLEATLTPTTVVEGKEELHATLTTTVGGGPFEITCSELSSPGATAENKETGGKMEVVGVGAVTYSNCVIPKPAGQGCTVHTAGNEKGMITSNSITSRTKDTAENKMEVDYVPTAGAAEPFVTLIVEGCKTEALNGNKPIYGSMLAEQTTPTSQTINVSTLHFGSPEGAKAEYKATVHFRTAGGTKNTIAFEAPSNAWASTMHGCVKEAGTGTKYSDAKCSMQSAEGEYQTKTLPATTPIGLEATLTPTTFVEGKEELHTVLTATVGGVPFEITCTELSSPGATAENKETGEVMEVVGKGTATYSACTMPKPAGQGCTVHTAGNEQGMITTNSIASRTKDTAENKMEVEYVPTAGAAEPFVTLIVEGCTTEALNGNKPIYGTALAEQTTPTSQAINVSTLHFGSPEGPAATYRATVHFNTGGPPETVALEAPSNAWASTMHECVKEAGTGTKYSDAKCSTQSAEGEYQTKTLPANTPIGLEATLTPTTFNGGEELHTVLTTVVGGVGVEITCTELSSPGATAENKETGEVMEVVGKGVVTYSNCTVPKPAGQGCTVHTGTEAAGMITTNSLSSKTIDTENGEMHVEYAPTAGAAEPFVTLILEKCKSGALNGNKPIYGSVLASQTTPTSQTVNVSTLHFGSSTGPGATYRATVHFKTGIPKTIALETP
jgi:hypothetical protein